MGSREATPASGGTRRFAVVGGGVAGLTAAYLLSRVGEVTLYEADRRLGGHADTHQIVVGDRTVAVDTGFIVHNDRTYPTLSRLLAELGVDTQESDMSMSVRCDELGLEYAGARGLAGLFPQPGSLARPAYLRMLAEVLHFHRMARRLLATPEACGQGGMAEDDETLDAFLDRGRFSEFFRTYFVRPLVAAVWSCDPRLALDYPARYLFTFLEHHGMLTVFGSPTWRTVVGGSARYVVRVAAQLHEVRLRSAVTTVRESGYAVHVTDATGRRDAFDEVVISAHPHQALGMLAEPTRAQRDVLGAMPYSTNVALLHTDEAVLPRSPRARASWNYWLRPSGDDAGGVLVSYDMHRLQRIRGVPDRRFIVTLGGEDLVDESTVIDRMHYEHPIYTPQSLAAQRRLPEVDTPRIVFAGAYHGWGFHEDGARSGRLAAERLGVTWDGPPDAAPRPRHETATGGSGDPDLVLTP